MKRVVVLGGSGFFGRLILEKLTAAGLKPLAASRSKGDLRIDANDPASIRAVLKPRDLVVDAAGPFHKRTVALIEAARTIGFDVIDLSDSFDYSKKIYDMEAPISAAGIRVLTACSVLSTISAMVLAASGLTEPRRLSAYIVPPSGKTASHGSASSMITSLLGTSRSFRFPNQLGRRWGLMIKTVDSITLPRVYPTLRTTQAVIDTRIWSMNVLLAIASRFGAIRRVMERYEPTIVDVIRRFGPKHGVVAYEIASVQANKYVVFSGEKTYMLSVLPAIHAAIAIEKGRFSHRGLVAPPDHIDAAELFEAVKSEGIEVLVPLREKTARRRIA
jgi:hypothetical protein